MLLIRRCFRILCGCSSLVELRLPKPAGRVRFPSSAPYCETLESTEISMFSGVFVLEFLLPYFLKLLLFCAFRTVLVGLDVGVGVGLFSILWKLVIACCARLNDLSEKCTYLVVVFMSVCPISSRMMSIDSPRTLKICSVCMAVAI